MIKEDLLKKVKDYNPNELEIIRSRMDENNRLEFPIIIPIVLYTGKQRWNAKINYTSYNTELARYRGLKKVEYNLVDINYYSIINEVVFEFKEAKFSKN